MKKRGFGVGRWNGFGGKVAEGESIEDAARRETYEEAGVVLGEIVKQGIINFSWEGKPEILEVHIFRAENFEGEPIESEEMRPQWFHVDEIPFGSMWADDSYWIPLLLKGKKFKGQFLFGEGDRIIDRTLSEVEDL